MLAVAVTTAMLGNWQSRRAGEKLALQERLDRMHSGPALTIPATPLPTGDWAQRRAWARGKFVAEGLILLDNRLRNGVPGYHVVMPLRIDGSAMHVLVNRGWIAAGPRRDRLPAVDTPREVQTVEGIAAVPDSNPYELRQPTGSATGLVRQNLVIERVAIEQRMALQPLVILQTSPARDGLVRDWPRPDARADTHRAYALQWYAMAVLAVVLWVALNLKRTRDAEP
jgi:surfeit locus 1 family protein